MRAFILAVCLAATPTAFAAEEPTPEVSIRACKVAIALAPYGKFETNEGGFFESETAGQLGVRLDVIGGETGFITCEFAEDGYPPRLVSVMLFTCYHCAIGYHPVLVEKANEAIAAELAAD